MDFTTLYRHFDEDGVLLYAGITDRGQKRAGEHRDKVWWRFVAMTTYKHLESRVLAKDCERWVIKTENPVFNVVHNTTSRDAAMFEYLKIKADYPGRDTLGDVRDIFGGQTRFAGPVCEDFDRFVRECLVLDAGKFVKTASADIYSRYVQWCDDQSVEPRSMTWLITRVGKITGVRELRYAGSRYRTNIALRTPA